MKILKINLQNNEFVEQPLADPLAGGRLLTTQIVSDLVDPHADPLGPVNCLVFAAGPLAGKRVSTGGRLSIGGKSPLTGGIKEANAGGMAGDSLSVLGYRALVLTRERSKDSAALIILDENGVKFIDAKEYWGLRNEVLVEKLVGRFGKDYVVISIGPAGEQCLKAAGIAITDEQGKPFRLAARGGLGAVMGSKGIKAILIRRAELADQKTNNPQFKRASIEFNKFVASNERVKELREFGTASTVMFTQTLAGLTVRNFSRGDLMGAEELGGEKLRDLILERGGVGSPTEACMSGCVIQCSNIVPDKDGKLAVAPLEYETLGLCGANLGITSLDDVARINRLCNNLGLDTIEMGAVLGVIMEAVETGTVPSAYDQFDLPHFGDTSKAIELIEEIGKGSDFGRLLGNGVVEAGQAFGVKHVPAVKGQAMSAYDPRIIKGTGVTYATSPQGADHTAGLTVFAPIDHTNPSLAVKASRTSQLQRAAYDALGLCVFNLGATGQRPDLVLDMLESQYAVKLKEGWLNQLGRRVIDLEIAFNRAAGFTKEDDRLPKYFESEILPPKGIVFDVSHDEMDAIWKEP